MKAKRAPIQDRAVRRRASILDAAARILDREGYDALTTNAVAREADTAVGTVYEYFADREAILAALLDRHRERLAVAIRSAITGDDALAIADRVVDAFARVWREEPGYRGAWSATQMTSLLERTGADWSDAFSAEIASLLRSFSPSFRAAEARTVAVAAVHLVSGMLLGAMTQPPAIERAVVAETKIALRAYLGARLFGRL